MSHSNAILPFYASPGHFTGPGEFSSFFTDLPDELPSLVKIDQNTLLHVFWAERYGVHLSEERKAPLQVRSVAEKLRVLTSEGVQSLNIPHLPVQRQVGNCRDFTLLLTSILRYKGIPARARCGFGAYFMPNHYEDHWVCEVWDAVLGRWKLVDAQLDEFQQQVLKPPFDPLDVPYDQFITGGNAWQMCRQGKAKPEQFGIFDMHGWWFIWGDLVRDFLALNKVEILPWDWTPEMMPHRLEDPLPAEGAELAFYDHIAQLTTSPDVSFETIRFYFQTDTRWTIPNEWK
jgi:hypothetical protein